MRRALDFHPLVKFDLADLAADPQQAEQVKRLSALPKKEQGLADDTQPLSSAAQQSPGFEFPHGKRKE